jgi:basic amino acid/polyamine antiporter, APA family
MDVIQSVVPMASPGTGSPAVRTSLLPVLGLLFGIAVSVGTTLGVGILRQPGPVASYLRAPWLIMLMWFVGAIYSACGASNVSELATMIPRAGGFYVYAREAMGDYAGFAVGWSDFLANVAPASYGAMAAVEFLQRLVPAVAPFGVLLAAGIILAFAAMQWFGVRLSARVQQAASAIAALALLGLVVACFLVRAPTGAGPVSPPPAGSLFAAMVLAIQSIAVTYDGWYEPIYFAEETRHPTRELPRAMFGGLALVAGIYLLLNGAFLRVLGPAGLAASKFAAADAAKLIFGRASEIVISVVAIVILLTLINGVLMSSTRILFAVSRDGLFWRRTALVAENGTPRPALAVATLVAVGLVVSGTVDRLIAMAGFFYVANYCWAYISLIVLRRTQPAAARPFHVFAYPALTLLTLAGSLAFLVGAIVSDRRNSLYALLLLMASVPVRSLFRARRQDEPLR